MTIRMTENNCQHEGRRVFFERYPLVSEHHSQAVMNPNGVMVKTHKLLSLLPRAERDCLIGVYLI